MAEQVCYVYGVIAAGASVEGAPPGIDGAEVRVETDDGVAALVSAVDAQEYEPARVEERSGDLSWIASRAEAHDRVLTWASDAAPVVPLPLLTLFTDAQSVRDMLADRREELERALARVRAGREYIVRIYRIVEELGERITSLSPAVAEVEGTLESAPPGQRYLLQRKLDGLRREEMRRISAEVGNEAYAALAEHAVEAALMPLPAQREEAPHPAVLNAAFLVSDERLMAFRSALTEVITRYTPGFRFEFTGPWPAYHFAGGGDA